jgi:hypothetical protein
MVRIGILGMVIDHQMFKLTLYKVSIHLTVQKYLSIGGCIEHLDIG